MLQPRFGRADIERWAREGLISADQRDALLADLESRSTGGIRLGITTILYFGGGLLVLLAYGFFLALQWHDLGAASRIAFVGLSFAFFAIASTYLLRDERTTIPGELLQVVAIATVAPLLFGVIDAFGIWPEDPGYRFSADRTEYERDLTWARMALAGASLIAAAVAFWWSRSPFVLGAALAAMATLVIDASLQVDIDRREYEWHTPQAMVIAALGAVWLAAGLAVRGRTERDYSLWLFVGALAALAAGLGTEAFADRAATAWGVLWLGASLALLALSILVQERLFAVAGLAAIFAYLARLVFDVFEDAGAALVLILLGLAILITGILYQRFGEPYFAQGRKPA